MVRYVMDEKYINFIYALVVGQVSQGQGNSFRDIWDCEEGVRCFVNVVMPTLMPNSMKINMEAGYYPISMPLKGRKFL